MTSIQCPCGWSRTILDGETEARARAAHEATDIHETELALGAGVTVAAFETESAAWLASARIAANGGPITTTFDGEEPGTFAVIATNQRDALAARAILASWTV